MQSWNSAAPNCEGTSQQQQQQAKSQQATPKQAHNGNCPQLQPPPMSSYYPYYPQPPANRLMREEDSYHDYQHSRESNGPYPRPYAVVHNEIYHSYSQPNEYVRALCERPLIQYSTPDPQDYSHLQQALLHVPDNDNPQETQEQQEQNEHRQLSRYNRMVPAQNAKNGDRHVIPAIQQYPEANWKNYHQQPSTSRAQNVGAVEASTSRDNPRDARNKAEKYRRDKLNSSISELATLVPLVAESSRKIDKTGVLRLTAHDLRKEYIFGESVSKPCQLDLTASAAEAVVDMMGGFFLTVTCRGIIVIVTANIEKHLGHCKIDLLGQNILSITHPEDMDLMKEQLLPKTIPIGPNGQLLIPPNLIKSKDKVLRDERRDFKVRLAKAVQRSEEPQYETCRIDGVLRLADQAGVNSTCQVLRRHRSRGEENFSPSGNDVVFIGMVRPIKIALLTERLVEAYKLEYRTRHLIDGRIVQCDQRISVVAGYMPSEISGVSAFTFMHRDDVRWVIIALRQMYDRNNQSGESCYRLMSRTGDFIYLKTKGYLEVNSNSNAVQSFVCINTLVSEAEGMALIDEMKMKYSVMIDINPKYPFSNSSGEPGIEDPHQLEQAIMHLITNLPSPATCFPRSPSPAPATPPPQPLSIIPPKPSTIKTTIAKSVSIINKVKCLDKIKIKYNANLTIINDSPFCSSINRPSVVQCNNKEKVYNSSVPKITASTSKSVQVSTNASPECSRVSTSSSKMYHPFINNQSNKIFKSDTSSFIEPLLPKEIKSIESKLDASLPIITDDLDLTLDRSDTNDTISQCSDLFNLSSFTCSDNENLLDVVVNGDLFESNEAEENIISSRDTLMRTFQALQTEEENFVDVNGPSTSFGNSLGVLKRTFSKSNLTDVPMSSKRKNNLSETSNSNELCNNESLNLEQDPKSGKVENVEDIYPLEELDIPQQGFDRYIHQLTDPNSDLCVIVPRSLAALETSITQIDGDVHSMNNQNQPYEQDQQQNLSDIMMEHEEQKQIFESIQQDFECNVDNTPNQNRNISPPH